ncbi:PqqD family protein [Tsuneonella dongtanensis]|uniref:PqqD family protein n=1 Tax=Tsuneonella dongtanensis TaxID=692370 RepID=UPI0018DC3C6B|nr:PqqD family protein [Tsuneonella dongtanensis]
MINLRSGRFSTMSGTALRIWELLDQTAELASVCSALEAEYDVEPGRCRAEVERFADELVAAGLARYD